MRILLLLVPISLVLLGVAVWAFVWAVRRGQFDDLDTPALDILREDGPGPRAAKPRAPEPHDREPHNPALHNPKPHHPAPHDPEPPHAD